MQDPRHTLILVRHAKSDWSGDEPDPLRPLARRGRRQAPEAGRWLAEHIERIDVAIVSPALRARQTWDLVSSQLEAPPPVRLDDSAYAATAASLVRLVRGLPEDAAVAALVGHNPGLEDLAATLAGRPVAMPTSAIAVLAMPGPWRSAGDAPAELVASGRPPPTPERPTAR